MKWNFCNLGPAVKSPTIASSEIVASRSSNVNLTCWMDFDTYCPEELHWHLNNNSEPLQENGVKFKVEEKDTHTKCEREFILYIFNVTENDEGTYSCHWICEYENTTKAAIDLKVFDSQPKGRKVSVVFLEATKASNSSNTKSHFQLTHSHTPSRHVTTVSRATGVPDVYATLQYLCLKAKELFPAYFRFCH